ncbi:hypothetical protein OIO07_23140 [Bacillus paralicheniformis]|uniref:hypothetical protein n=1 Tax=Bacillus paralicheniformis TaxID=1648923 RepID=UPI0021F3C993|nr:hypothetical protein [Bacillus paralicheniformis]MCV9371108.1 hypothetical protein [Bacillus paralicheniformis]WIG10010.1 hypothetical protein QN340_22910 [Bacillus paralicheniformis]
MTKTNEKIHVLADESLGGIKREYVEVDRKAKVGEEIIAIEESLPYFCEGDYGKVISVWCDDVWANFESNYNNKPWFISHERYHVLEPTNVVHIDGPDGTERYEMVDRPPEIGGKVLRPSDGFVAEVVDFDIHYVYVPGAGVYADDLLTLVPVESSEEEPQPSDPIDVIANLATRVAELERENKRIKEDLGWNEMGPGRIAELRNADSDIRHDIAALEEKVEHDRAENVEMDDYVYEEMKRMKDEIDTLHKDNRRHGEELEALKYAAKETDGKVAHLEADIEESFPATDAPFDASLVFVQRKMGDGFEVYQDGKRLRGIQRISIEAAVGEFTTHEIEYISGATEEERQ